MFCSRVALVVVVGFATLSGCKRTEGGDVVVKRPVHVTVTTRPETINVSTRTETVKTPIVTQKRETVVVDKPVVTGVRKTPIKVPVIEDK